MKGSIIIIKENNINIISSNMKITLLFIYFVLNINNQYDVNYAITNITIFFLRSL